MANMEITWSNFDGERDVIGTRIREIMDGTTSLPKQPSKEHKDGIRVYVSSGELFPEPYRELLTNSYYAQEAFKQLYKKYQKEADKHEDDAPIVTFSKPKDKATKKRQGKTAKHGNYRLD